MSMHACDYNCYKITYMTRRHIRTSTHGGQMAIERIEKLCQRYVRLIGKPFVQAISTTKDR